MSLRSRVPSPSKDHTVLNLRHTNIVPNVAATSLAFLCLSYIVALIFTTSSKLLYPSYLTSGVLSKPLLMKKVLSELVYSYYPMQNLFHFSTRSHARTDAKQRDQASLQRGALITSEPHCPRFMLLCKHFLGLHMTRSSMNYEIISVVLFTLSLGRACHTENILKRAKKGREIHWKI